MIESAGREFAGDGAAAAPDGVGLLCCDLDGTLTPMNTVSLSVRAVLMQWPLMAAPMLGWLLGGQAYAKQRVARLMALDASGLPYHPLVVDYLREQRRAGRRIVLATATDWAIASRVADYLGVFDDVIASDGRINCRGRAKRRQIEGRYPNQRYGYIGDAWADRAVWRGAAERLVVTRDGRVPWWARDLAFDRVFATEAGSQGD